MSQKVVISLKNGKVRGVKERSSVFDADFYSFYGIPYAQPPVGSLRFKASQYIIYFFHELCDKQ